MDEQTEPSRKLNQHERRHAAGSPAKARGKAYDGEVLGPVPSRIV